MSRLPPRLWLSLAAISGAIAVGAGAFGAHGVADPTARSLLSTGASYQMSHALAVFACAAVAALGGERAWSAAPLFLAGAALFSGSLYALALGAPRWIGAVTPIGGLAFIAGWIVLAFATRAIAPRPAPPV